MRSGFDKNMLISRSNIRKAKGQTAAIVVLVFLSSMMMNLWLMLATDYKQNFDRYYDKLNDGHVNFCAYRNDEDYKDYVRDLLESRTDITEYCITDGIGWVGTFKYNNGEANSNLIFLEKDTAISRSVGKIEIVEDSEYTSGIYLPLLYGSQGNYSAGDEIEISLGSEKMKYTVCGFVNSVSAGSHNCALCAMLLTEDKYKELSENMIVPKETLVSARIADKTMDETAETQIKDSIVAEFKDINIISNSYNLVSSSRYISQSICAAILSAMAFLITLVALVVISSNVMNYIHEDMQNLGALKAVGYKSRQLISALIMQFSGVALITAAIGTAVSYIFFPALNEMMISQTGIPYAVRFLPIPCAVTIIFTAAAVSAAVFVSSRRIRKIEPITALRQGINTHNFKKNHVPLDKTGAPLNLAIALKTVLSGAKQNVTVSVTMLVLSLVIVFSGVMIENIVVDTNYFIHFIVGETSDSCINVNISSEERLKEALGNDSRVKSYYQFTSAHVTHVGGVSLMATMCDDFSQVNNQDMVIEGRFPKFDNEIAIAIKYAKERGLKIGDEVFLSGSGIEEKYIISGFTQITNNLGKDCLLTRSGYERIAQLTNVSYYINVPDDVDIDAFNKDITEPFSDEVNALLNTRAIIEGSSKVYISLMTVIVIAVLILSGVIISFVLYLLVRTMLNNKKRDYGIMKALGFTSGQLIVQTALSFMPPLIISAAVGITVGSFVINPLMAIFLSGIGIVKCTFDISLGFNVLAGIGLILFAFGAACLMSRRIKRIAPRELLTGE